MAIRFRAAAGRRGHTKVAIGCLSGCTPRTARQPTSQPRCACCRTATGDSRATGSFDTRMDSARSSTSSCACSVARPSWSPSPRHSRMHRRERGPAPAGRARGWMPATSTQRRVSSSAATTRAISRSSVTRRRRKRRRLPRVPRAWSHVASPAKAASCSHSGCTSANSLVA